MLLALLLVVAVVSGSAGYFVGWWSTLWALRTKECPRCRDRAVFMHIEYMCAFCGDQVTEEEL